ncbi:MAG: hypothetical protein ACR2F8_11425 [Caulobacteraceae bacterium]
MFAIVIAVVFAITPRSERAETGVFGAAALLFVGFLMIPAVREVSLRHRRGMMFVGIATIVAGACVLAAGLFPARPLNADITVEASVLLFLAGVLLTQLPRISADMEGAVKAQNDIQGVGSSPETFHPAIEVRRALTMIFEQKAAFARLVGPWLKAHLPSATPFELNGIEGLIGLVSLIVVSPFAIGMAAMALDPTEKTILAQGRALRIVGRKYYAGIALILTPYTILSWMLSSAYDNYNDTSVKLTCVWLVMVLLFLVAIVSITYVTRVYLKGKPVTGTSMAAT